MGEKTLIFSSCLIVFSALLSFAGLFLPMHRIDIMSGFFRWGTLRTYSLRYAFDWKRDNDMCLVVAELFQATVSNTAGKKCHSVSGSYDLLSGVTRVCTPFSRSFSYGWPALCSAFQYARSCGITLVLCVVTQVVLQMIAIWLNYQYITVTPRKTYRDTSTTCVVIGALMTFVALIFYTFFAMQSLDELGQAKSALGMNPAFGLSYGAPEAGFVCLWVCVALQVVTILLMGASKTKAEEAFQQRLQQQKDEYELSTAQAHRHQDPFPGAYPGQLNSAAQKSLSSGQHGAARASPMPSPTGQLGQGPYNPHQHLGAHPAMGYPHAHQHDTFQGGYPREAPGQYQPHGSLAQPYSQTYQNQQYPAYTQPYIEPQYAHQHGLFDDHYR